MKRKRLTEIDHGDYIRGYVAECSHCGSTFIGPKDALWRAPTKGGIFTTEERALLKGTHKSQATGKHGDRG